MDRRYSGQAVDITYSLKRCIHAEQCIHHLAQVFDNHRRPWILSDGAAPNEVAHVVELCPSGALHYERKDGGPAEQPDEENVVSLRVNGPLQIRGDLTIEGTSVAVQGETRATLCRCGGSANKPFCDNAHRENGFAAPGPLPQTGATQVLEVRGGTLHITPLPDGPLQLTGHFQIANEQGDVLFAGESAALCRCGHSEHKPFCDGTHEKVGFKAD